MAWLLIFMAISCLSNGILCTNNESKEPNGNTFDIIMKKLTILEKQEAKHAKQNEKYHEMIEDLVAKNEYLEKKNEEQWKKNSMHLNTIVCKML